MKLKIPSDQFTFLTDNGHAEIRIFRVILEPPVGSATLYAGFAFFTATGQRSILPVQLTNLKSDRPSVMVELMHDGIRVPPIPYSTTDVASIFIGLKADSRVIPVAD